MRLLIKRRTYRYHRWNPEWFKVRSDTDSNE